MDSREHERLAKLDREHVWHPFTQMQGWPDEQVIIERAEGSWLVDTLGKRYLDGTSSLWVTVHGHRRREIDDAIRAQLERVAHTTLLGLGSVPSIELAERLVRIAPPGLSRVFYSDSGSTSVEIALKLAYQYWKQKGRPQKRKFVALGEAYHGDTIGSVSVGGVDLFHQIFDSLLFESLRIPTPYTYRSPWASEAECRDACLKAAEEVILGQKDEIAAVIVEPLVQGAAGMLMQPEGYLRGLRELCDRAGVLLICDEVATGFGRTGTMFACEQEGVRPDLMCIAKGITGGYLPLAATLATDELYSAFLGAFAEKRTFFHGHTYTGNPLACAAALANLDVFEKERTLEALPAKSAALAKALDEARALPHVGEIRQRGLMVGIELVKERATKQEYPYDARIGHQVILEARRHGVMLRPLGGVVVLMPPLSITADELALLGRVTTEAIAKVTG